MSQDLSGVWDGIYHYPDTLAPVPFSAAFTEEGGALSGAIEEVSDVAGGAPRKVMSEVEGRRAGAVVTWLKMYADRAVAHDVQYEGEVSPDGAEITGAWTVFGDWSGSFEMRRRPPGAARRRNAGAQRA